MQDDIDMRSYAGEQEDSVAESPGANSYTQETSEYPVDESLLDKPIPVEPIVEDKPEQNSQADNFRAFREEVERLRADREVEKREHAMQMDMLKANLDRQQRQQAEPPKKMFDSMRDDDVPNVAELRREWESREANYQARLEELQVQQMYPDYNEVLQKYVVPLINQKPHLAEGLQGARNKALFAYELGKMAQNSQPQQPITQQMQQPTQPSTIAQKIVDNARKPGTLSQAGGQGALSKADYYASMSDKDFNLMASKNLEGI